MSTLVDTCSCGAPYSMLPANHECRPSIAPREVFGMKVIVNLDLPPGTIEIRVADQCVGKIINLSE